MNFKFFFVGGGVGFVGFFGNGYYFVLDDVVVKVVKVR